MKTILTRLHVQLGDALKKIQEFERSEVEIQAVVISCSGCKTEIRLPVFRSLDFGATCEKCKLGWRCGYDAIGVFTAYKCDYMELVVGMNVVRQNGS